MFKKLLIMGFCVIVISSASLVKAALFDFQAWIAVNGEQGFLNSSPFSDTVDGITLTATAFENGQDSHVYMDDRFNNIIGGMGVCSALNTAAKPQCIVSSDDNVSIDAGSVEVLSWNFSQNIAGLTLELGDTDHFDYANRSIEYNYSGSWITATSNGAASLTLALDGSSDTIMFRAVGEGKAKHFYIRNADVTVVPVPAAVWLFASGLLGLVAVARRRN